MICPRCKMDQNEVSTGYELPGGEYKRYRHCINCDYVFKTVEKIYTKEEVDHQKRSVNSKVAKKRFEAIRINKRNGVSE